MKVKQKTQTILRYQNSKGSIFYGVLDGIEILQLSSTFTELVDNQIKFDGVKLLYNEVKVLEPVIPTKFINFGWTYAEHAREAGGKPNLKEPLLFFKPQSALIPNQEEIILPSTNITKQVEMEGEVGLIIGKRCKDIREEEALDYVFGCTIINDVTARDLTKRDPQYTRGKGFDTFGPIGPWIVTGIDPTNLQIITTLNGRVVQRGNTNQMSFSIPFLISWVSKIMTLEPGDVLATGSPAGSCPMKPGDIVAVEVPDIGKLCNYVR